MEERETSLSNRAQQDFAEGLGRFFELGFNTGLLAALQQQQEVVTYYGTIYEQDLASLRFPKLVDAMYKLIGGNVTLLDQAILKRWFLFFLQKGYLSGVNFFTEYLQSFQDHQRATSRHIVYLQCNFYGQNSLGTYEKNAHTAIPELMTQFQKAGYTFDISDEDIAEYMHKGNFLNADVLLLLKYGRYWRILCVDLSVFSIRALHETSDLSNMQAVHRMLTRELNYARSKGVFTNLSIDAEEKTTSAEIVSGQLTNYFTAFKREDKESVKLIQAASYTHSFYNFLKNKGVIDDTSNVVFNVVGYTDRSINTIAVHKEQIALLATCATLYKEHSTTRTITEARDYVLQTIQKAASRSFEQGPSFTKALLQLADTGDGVRWLRHTETLEGFANTRTPLKPEQIGEEVRHHLAPKDYEGKNLLDVHAALAWQELTRKDTPYLFLTGHPGVGKTTSLVNFLKAADQRGEGFLFLYVSPRKQVNLDIIQKFREDTGDGFPACDNLFALTANTLIIRNNNTRKTVHYYSQQRHDTFVERGVTFIHAESPQALEQSANARSLEEIQEGLLIDKGERISGVLDSLCSALHATLEKPLAHAIVATVAVQSLKRTGRSGENTTLRHLDKIFEGFYSQNETPIPHKMQQLAKQAKHIFVMIDEVTADEGGVAFLHGLHTFLQKRQLLNSPYGINTKIIVADASIVGSDVIQQHLSLTDYEPDKIYVRRVSAPASPPALAISPLTFKKTSATVINANAFPASKLNIHYKIGIDAIPHNEETFPERSKALQEEVQKSILEEILSVLDTPNAPQLLVYIQSKQRLARLIQKVRDKRGSFERDTEFLEIHANVSERQKEAISKYRKTTKIVFMTASASRGLSFPNAKHIIVDIPHFEIEQNLMEILQVIYRGRGGDSDQDEKMLTFYLIDQIVYSEQEDRQLAVRESMLHLLNVLLILKTSIMTRIQGSGRLGLNQHFMMVPIGGKSVFAAGETFTSRMERLLKELQDLHHLNRSDKRLETVHERLAHTLAHADIDLISSQHSTKGNSIKRQSYLSLIPTFNQIFEEAVNKSFASLLHFPPLEVGYVSGGLLTVPILDKAMQEKYWLQVEKAEDSEEQKPDLLNTMYALSKDREYPESLHMALRDAIALIKALKDIEANKFSYYAQESYHTDQHYTIPLVTFVVADLMRKHFANNEEQTSMVEATFHSILSEYIRKLYPANSLLPIGNQYDEFPFIVFRSLNLGEARRKMFTGKYLFMSHEFNIINMLLSSKE